MDILELAAMRLAKSVSRTRAYGTKTHAETATRFVASKAIGALNPHLQQYRGRFQYDQRLPGQRIRIPASIMLSEKRLIF